MQGTLAPSGSLTFNKYSTKSLFTTINPFASTHKEVRTWRWKNLPYVLSGLWRVTLAKLTAKITHLPVIYGTLYLTKIDAHGVRYNYGCAGFKVVTTAGVNFIVDAFQNSVELENMRFHGIGTGSTAEAIGDTALVTELTTEYTTNNTRATGSQTENGANVFRTVGTNPVDAAVNLREHGIFTQAATGGGTLLDRTVFASINLASGDSLESTYDITFTAGS